MAMTKVENLINPQVMSDMISAKIPDKIVVTPFAKVDTTLQGRAGDTITVPKYAYIGDAQDVAEGASCPTNQLTATTAQYTVKKAMKAVSLTDEAVLSGYGNPVGEANSQLAKAIASKIDNDAIDALLDATTVYDGTAGQISYDGIVLGVDKFNEEIQTDKVMFVAPAQVTTLRLDDDFISADKYGQGTNVMMRGEIGMIAGVRIVPTRKIKASQAVNAVQGVYTMTISGTATHAWAPKKKVLPSTMSTSPRERSNIWKNPIRPSSRPRTPPTTSISAGSPAPAPTISRNISATLPSRSLPKARPGRRSWWKKKASPPISASFSATTWILWKNDPSHQQLTGGYQS
mgnify:CR=1 FL=1